MRKILLVVAVLALAVPASASAGTEIRNVESPPTGIGRATAQAYIAVPYGTWFYRLHSNAFGPSGMNNSGFRVTVNNEVFYSYFNVSSRSWSYRRSGDLPVGSQSVERFGPAEWGPTGYMNETTFRVELVGGNTFTRNVTQNNWPYYRWETGPEGKVWKGTIWVRG